MKLKWWHVALFVALLAAFLSPLASKSPDGLERVAEDKGFSGSVSESPVRLMADYLFPGVHNEALATILAGVIGILAIFGLVYGLAWLLRRRQGSRAE